MALPSDIEDIIGAGCLATITRFLAGLSCIWLGSCAGIMALYAPDQLSELWHGYGLDFDSGDVVMAIFAAPVWWLFTSAGFIGVPVLIATFVYFVKAEGGSLRVWMGLASVYGILVLAGGVEWGWNPASWLSLGFLVGFLGALWIVAFTWVNWQRRRFAVHLMAVAAENEARRRVQEHEELAATAGDSAGDQPPAALPPGDSPEDSGP